MMRRSRQVPGVGREADCGQLADTRGSGQMPESDPCGQNLAGSAEALEFGARSPVRAWYCEEEANLYPEHGADFLVGLPDESVHAAVASRRTTGCRAMAQPTARHGWTSAPTRLGHLPRHPLNRPQADGPQEQ